uniref:Uncharacterized protein n=1 Tax=Oryza sativa subsp. japonica TaxID=39947 RepID=Q2R6P8_ORYSJ|nr:hypothetical protein LOC_Os11g19300 [Oryza sativa Japonica Group]
MDDSDPWEEVLAATSTEEMCLTPPKEASIQLKYSPEIAQVDANHNMLMKVGHSSGQVKAIPLEPLKKVLSKLHAEKHKGTEVNLAGGNLLSSSLIRNEAGSKPLFPLLLLPLQEKVEVVIGVPGGSSCRLGEASAQTVGLAPGDGDLLVDMEQADQEVALQVAALALGIQKSSAPSVTNPLSQGSRSDGGVFASDLPPGNASSQGSGADLSASGNGTDQWRRVPTNDRTRVSASATNFGLEEGPDGLNATFYRSAWSWIKDDLMALIQDFYQTGPLVFAMFLTKFLPNPLLTGSKVPVMQANTEDKLYWKHTKNGECNTKSAYKEVYKSCRTDFDRFPINSHVALIIAFVINNDPNKTNLSRLLIVMWQLWKARNDLKFYGIFKEPSQDDVQSEACKRKMDSIPNGIRCYLDATWDNGRTGIGIFFHFPHNHTVIFIKATSDKAHSSLQAELLALQLSLEIAIFLNFAGVTFLTDNATIADTTMKRNFMEDLGDWS